MRWPWLTLLLAACGADPVAVEDARVPALDAALPDSGQDDASRPDAGASPWRDDPALPVPIQEIAVEAHDGRIHVAGGIVEGAVVDTLHVFDPGAGIWSEGPPLPAPRHHMSLVSHAGDLYALGGMETLSFAPLDTAWVLRAGADTWTEIAPLPVDRGAAAADAVGDVIVMVGGNESRGGLAQRTLVYDPARDAWRFGAPIPTEREHLAAVTVGAELFVLAGRRNSLSTNRTELEIYDPTADTGRSGPALPTARGGVDAARLAGKSEARIALEHVLPNAAPIIATQAATLFAVGILAEAGLSYVGLGAQPPAVSWGRMLAEAQTLVALAPQLALWPGLAIAITVFAGTAFGEALRARLDPRAARGR